MRMLAMVGGLVQGVMQEVFDIAIVGAGMFGSAAAKYISKTGARTLVVGPAEPPPGVTADQWAFGAHFDEARITRRLGWDRVWGATDASSLRRFKDIEDETDIRFFHECGSLVLMAKTIGSRTDAMMAHCAAQSIEVDRLTEAGLRSTLPFIGLPPMRGGVEGLYERRMAGYLNPRQLVRAQLVLAERAGAVILRAAVTKVSKDRDGGLWQLRAESGGNVTQLQAEKVLLATGSFTNHNGVLPNGRKLAIRTFAEPNLLFEVADADVARLENMPTVVTVDPEDTGNANMSAYLLPPSVTWTESGTPELAPACSRLSRSSTTWRT